MASDSAMAYRGASPGAIEHHYDVGNDFYALWLDRTLTYSCALWEPGDTLETAQRRKLEFLAAQAELATNAHVLDIGCGWGSFMRHVVGADPGAEIVGLTLSPSQAAWIREREVPGCRVEVVNWADYAPPGRFDAIVSAGAFEHFARPGLKVGERVATYRSFFERCAQWLVPGGRLVLQTIVKGSNVGVTRAATREIRFISDVIFPQSELPWPSEIAGASERALELLRASSHADDYARTGRAWYDRLRSRRERAIEVSGEERVAAYERYLKAFPRLFEARHVNLMRLTFAAPSGG